MAAEDPGSTQGGLSMRNVALEKAIKDKAELAVQYGVPTSSIVWIGDNHYIVVKNGQEIKIGG